MQNCWIFLPSSNLFTFIFYFQNDFQLVMAKQAERQRLAPARLPLQKSISTPSIIASRELVAEAAPDSDKETLPVFVPLRCLVCLPPKTPAIVLHSFCSFLYKLLNMSRAFEGRERVTFFHHFSLYQSKNLLFRTYVYLYRPSLTKLLIKDGKTLGT